MNRSLHLQAPLLPLAVCLVIGIVVGSHISCGLPLLLLFVGLLVVTCLVWRWPMVQSVMLGVCVVVLGMLVAPSEEKRVADGVWTEAVVASAPTEKPKTMMMELLLPATGERRRCYVWKDERSQSITLGQNLIVRISEGQFVRYKDWQFGGDAFNRTTNFHRLKIRVLRWREQLLGKYRTPDADVKAQAVLAAMVLGDKSALTPELRETYSVTGASHVLALSGLHLSIIYLVLTTLTLGRRRFWLGQVLVVLAVWAFALLTGLSTSVTRAALMLTVYALFALGGRRHAPLGVLSFTAILMLLIDSRSLFDIGFQLSFMAMLGILLFVPLFDQFVSVKWMMSHRLIRIVYGLVAVSVAAQLGTAPLVAYYFGRFSTWFLLTNLFVIPVVTLLLYGAALAIIVPAIIGALLWLTGVLNTGLEWLSHLPLASIEGLHPSVLQTVMVYVLIGVLYVLLFRMVRSRGVGASV